MRRAFAISLRAAGPQDHGALQCLRADTETRHSLLSHPEHENGETISDWLERRAKAGRVWVIAAGENDDCLGFVQISGVHGIDLYAYFGIALLPEYRGQGIAKNALLQFIEIASSELGLRKLILDVRADNAPAIGLYHGLGFRTVGTLEAHYDDGNRLYDVVTMERRLADPRARRT